MYGEQNKKMIKVFCVDLGYSLKKEYRRWKENHHAYPPQALYGINHFCEYGIEPVFEMCEHKDFYKKKYIFIDEIIKAVSLFRYRNDYDAIYIPHAHYSRWIVVLHWMRIIKVPIVVCLHNKNNLWKLIYACDHVITINPELAHEMKQKYRAISIDYIPLLPEKKQFSATKIKYDVVSIGNTNRDYSTLIEAMSKLPYKCCIVTTNELHEKLPSNVVVINNKQDYETCLNLYLQSKVIVLPVKKETSKGVFGLTSLVDALYVCKPLIVSKTQGIGVPVEELKLGYEVPLGDADEMKNAIEKIMEDRAEYDKIQGNMYKFREEHNMSKSAEEICSILKEVVSR